MKKVGRCLFVVPLIVYLAVQVIVTLAGSVAAGAKAAMTAPQLDAATIQTMAIELYKKMVPFILVLAHAVTILVAVIWVFVVFKKRKQDIGVKRFGMRAVPVILLLGIGIQYLCHGALALIYAINPQILSNYERLMESSGLNGQNTLTLIAAVCLAPIGEELMFRVLTMDFLKRAGATFWVANIIQAVCFGIAHLNLVQGIYAFFMGIMFGWVYEKYHSLPVAILVHAVVNFTGTIVVPALGAILYGDENPGLLTSIIILLVAAAITAGGVLLSGKNTVAEECSE